MSKKTTLPPLNPLHVFEVASRLESFTKAARELNVTQSAVSRQIATLEASLNVMLFNRGKDGISLSTSGEYYRREISQAFARIQNATNELRDKKQSDPVRLRVYSTFASRWLIPRLSKFKKKYPEIDLQMNTATKPVDFMREGTDIAIQFGEGEWAGSKSKLIFQDEIEPVCSPEFLDQHRGKELLQLLQASPLIQARLRTRDWCDWLEAVDVDSIKCKYMEFPSSLLAYQAAASGLGVAMGQKQLVKSDVDEGRLMYLFNRPVKRSMGYYAIWPETLTLNTKMRAFLNWLINEAKSDTKAG
ncbi:LysR substrate-binding domain-containing protein [Oricola sp.]|uniref:LysR substrate-binding domain-containing protein n=1 Tax=Oricola sp. TaxID=1979950 RepID=UPI003BAC4184